MIGYESMEAFLEAAVPQHLRSTNEDFLENFGDQHDQEFMKSMVQNFYKVL